MRNYRTVLAVADREWNAWRRWAEDEMRKDIAQYLATSNPSDTLVRHADEAVNYFHIRDQSSGLTDEQRQGLANRHDRLPAITDESDEDEE